MNLFFIEINHIPFTMHVYNNIVIGFMVENNIVYCNKWNHIDDVRDYMAQC